MSAAMAVQVAAGDANCIPAAAQADKQVLQSPKIPSLGCTKCRYALKGSRKCRAERQSALKVSPAIVRPPTIVSAPASQNCLCMHIMSVCTLPLHICCACTCDASLYMLFLCGGCLCLYASPVRDGMQLLFSHMGVLLCCKQRTQ